MRMKGKRAKIAWNNSTVRSGAELDSSVVANLDVGCEVVISERYVLASGRERCKIEMPVEGWISTLFLEEELSDPEEDSKNKKKKSKQKQVFEAGSLSQNVLAGIFSREGNTECYECRSKIHHVDNEWICENDGETAWANIRQGTILCWSCGERSGNCRSLELDAFTSAMNAVLLCGGNHRCNEFKNNEHYTTALWGLAEAPYCELAIEPNERRCAADLYREVRLNMQFQDRITITETHGNRAVVVRSDCARLQAGDYIVGVGTKRVWRFHDVVARVKNEKSIRAQHYGRWRLVVRRIKPCLEENYYDKITTPNKAQRILPKIEKKASKYEEQAIQSGGGLESDEASINHEIGGSFSSYAIHSSVVDYWHAIPEHKGSVSDDTDKVAASSLDDICPEQDTNSIPHLAALVLNYDQDITNLVRRGSNGEAVLRCGRIVGVNSHRKYLTHEHVLDHLTKFRKPILLLLTPAIDSEAPFIKIKIEPGPLGIRLKETPEAVLVERVQPSSASAIAGIRQGYALALVDGLPVASLQHALDLLQWHRPCIAVFLLSSPQTSTPKN